MTTEELQTLLVAAKLTMVRYFNALQAIKNRARLDSQTDIERLAAVALRDTDA